MAFINPEDLEGPGGGYVNPDSYSTASQPEGMLVEIQTQRRAIHRYLKTRNNLRDCGRMLGKLAGRMEVAADKIIDETIILDLRAEFEKVKIRVGGRVKICRDMY